MRMRRKRAFFFGVGDGFVVGVDGYDSRPWLAVIGLAYDGVSGSNSPTVAYKWRCRRPKMRRSREAMERPARRPRSGLSRILSSVC